jgi:tRNA pseudouridine13 synthase
MDKAMKLRQAPKDFKVEELSELDVSDEDLGFGLYRLEKRGLDTFTLLAYLSKRLGVPYKEFGIAGLKDRHAVTKQYLTIPSKYQAPSVEEENFKLEHVGYLGRPLDLGDLKANRFEITVRDLRKVELQGVPERARDLEAFGFPNYFDSQRFGSVIHGEFMARHVIRGDLERAVKIFLTAYTRYEKGRIKADKRAILENWDDLGNVRPATGILAKVIEVYKATKDWSRAFKAIPRNLRELYMSAYQSYLWNECIKAVLMSKVRRERLFTVHYDLGELVFYKRLEKDEAEGIPRTFKTVSHRLDPSPYEGKVIDGILKREGLALEDLNIKKRTGCFFKVYDREVTVRPEGLSVVGPSPDELNDRSEKGGLARSKLVLAFTLPKGSYATVLTKRIFKR